MKQSRGRADGEFRLSRTMNVRESWQRCFGLFDVDFNFYSSKRVEVFNIQTEVQTRKMEVESKLMASCGGIEGPSVEIKNVTSL